MSIERLQQNVLKNAPLNKEELHTFCEAFYPKSIAKKQYLLQQGDICKFEGYVTKGCFRVFTLDEQGKEHVLYFAIKDWWITDIDSFTNQKPSFLTIQALEDSEVLLIDHQDKARLYTEIPQVEQLFRVMTQKTLVALQRRMISNLSQTADARYLDFIEKYPQIAQKLTNLQLASYLGISHEFLSKIRSKTASK
ncbi:Crp/Fnr family transcriptional regulator [Zobellia galactanivorans]|uniref:Crp/Fnr family transcriptional regulator n=1 Tax=Zobellia TaxID=112040 RepID=UPI0026E17386|nr:MULTISPECIES: Crp/Fnr family transcriptional regulator [Zobellia]MDO6519121.1 Crp/Fnr family transcriptional regulator [Zobellia uliginosa]MDO6809421.1 Crp/Fnr family transcriptional regulator [Zobellia galactanivorans]